LAGASGGAARGAPPGAGGEAQGREIEGWLTGDRLAPANGADNYDADAELENTKVEFIAGQDTQHELPKLPASNAPTDPGDMVTLESGRKMKIGNAKAKIEKTRDDTSSAAADILRRVMERRRR
jgi:hypothetical protein